MATQALVAHRSERLGHDGQRRWHGTVLSQQALEARKPLRGFFADHQASTGLAKSHELSLSAGQRLSHAARHNRQ